MKESSKTKSELLAEISKLKQKNKELKKSEANRKRAEEALQESEKKYRLIAENTADLISILDMNLRFTYVSPATMRLRGFTVEEAMGQTLDQVLTPESMQFALPVFEKEMELEASGTADPDRTRILELEEYKKDGSIIWVEVSLSFLRDKNRKPVEILIVTHDITDRKQTELRLTEAERKFRTIADLNYDWENWIGADGKPIWVSPAVERFSGYSISECMAMPDFPFPIIHPDDHGRLLAKMREANERPLNDIEFHIIRKDGVNSLWAVSTNPVFNEDGSSAGHRSSLRDITERKRVEEALRRSEANYRQLFDTSPTAIYQIDFRTGKFLKANDIICEYFGCTQKEITSLSPYDLLTDQSKQLLLERLRQMGLGEKVTENPEYEFIDKSGKRRWLQLNSKNIYDSEGSVIGADVVAHEITERKQSEEELLESEEKYRNVFENANEAIFVAQEGNLIYFNPITSIISGYPGEELTSRPFVDFIYPDDRDMVIDRHIRRIKGEDVPQRYSYRIIHKDGSIRWAEASAILINWKGKPAVLNFVNDITERKRAEDEKRSLEERLQRAEKMEALGTLAGGVAHDLNNVLGVILGFAELLLNEVDESSPLRSNLTIIMNGSEKASLIVQDLLTLARRSVPSRKVLNLNKIILDYQTSPELENLSSYHPAMHIKLDLEPDLLNISGSSVHLEKALFNLASNAVEAMPKGGNLTIKTANQYLDKPIYGYDTVREGDYVVLSVTDTGEGIPSADLQRIFEPFYTKKVMGRSGTGLGLAVVWGTVKDHQGYINVQSEEGKGSTFTLYFPVTREEISVAAASVSISEYLGKGETILVVDDVQEQRQLAAAMLKKLNYKVSSVASGESAIEYLKNHKVDLLVLDMIMDPGMDGLDTYKSVLKIQPQQKTIIVSGFSETQRVNEAQALGAGAYVKKPYITEKLGLAVRKELDKSA